MKLGLGTVQFGVDYGIANREGQCSPEEVGRILLLAARSGVRVLDTAALYGTSEEVLGKTLPDHHSFAVVTKTPKFTGGCIAESDARLLEDTFQLSLAKLKLSSVYGLLFHNADDLLSENSHLLIEKAMELKQRGLVQKIGVSVYTGEQIDHVFNKYHLDLIQVPVNVLDQRLLAGGYLSELKKAGVEIHARSVFLQGLLLMKPEALPSYFDPVREHLKNYHQTIRQRGISPVQAALGFVAGLDEIDVVLCGVTNQQQLEELIKEIQKPVDCKDFTRFAVADGAMVDPSKWKF